VGDHPAFDTLKAGTLPRQPSTASLEAMTPAASAFAPHRSLAIVRRLPGRDGAIVRESGNAGIRNPGNRGNPRRVRQCNSHPAPLPDPFGAPEAEWGGSEKGEKSLRHFAKAVFNV
jgi:hypothetical protein